MELIDTAVNKLKEENNKDNFSANGDLRLKPIFEEVDKKISYDDIKVALLYL